MDSGNLDDLEGFSIRSPAASGNTWMLKKRDVVLKINNSLSLYRELGEKIASCREAKGLSQKDLATILNTGCDRIKNLELGRCRPSGLLVKAIAQTLNIKLSDLIPKVLLTEKPKVVKEEDEELTLFDFMEEHYFHVAMGRKILRLQRARKLTVKDLAILIESDLPVERLVNYVRKLEKGDVRPDIFFLALLAQALEVSIDDLFPAFEIDKLSGFAKLLKVSDLAVLKTVIEQGKARELLNVINDRLSCERQEMTNRGEFFVS